MSATLENDLRQMYATRSAHLPTEGPGLDLGRTVPRQPHRGSRWLVGAAAAALLVVGVGGVFLIDRPSATDVGTPPSATEPPVTSAGPGRLTLGAPPAGMELIAVTDEPASVDPGGGPVVRLYGTASAASEVGPLARLTAYRSPEIWPQIPAAATAINIDGIPGHRW